MLENRFWQIEEEPIELYIVEEATIKFRILKLFSYGIILSDFLLLFLFLMFFLIYFFCGLVDVIRDKQKQMFINLMFQFQKNMDASNLAALPLYAYHFMVLLTLDLLVLLLKAWRGVNCIKFNFKRTYYGRYKSISIVFYLSGIVKLLLVDFSFFTGGEVVISIPILALTAIYLMSIIFFWPILRWLGQLIDKSHLKVLREERIETMRRETMQKLKE